MSFPQVQECLNLSYKNARELNLIIGRQLPGRPAFVREEVIVAGQTYEIYHCNILDSIQALYSDPEFTQQLVFVPERHYSNPNKTDREYHEMHTGDWWWETQVSEASHSGRFNLLT